MDAGQTIILLVELALDAASNADSVQAGMLSADETVEAHGGRIVGRTNNRIVAAFGSEFDAASCATELRRQFANGDTGFRAAVVSGELSSENNRIVGGGFEEAKQLLENTDAGEIVLSARVRDGLNDTDAGGAHLATGLNWVRKHRSPGMFLLRDSPPAAAVQPVARPGIWHSAMLVAGVAIVVLLVSLAIWQGRLPTDILSQPPQKFDFTRDHRLTLAVLPFDTSDSSGDYSWLGEGLAEDIMTALSRFRDLGIVARSSSFRYAGQENNLEKLRSDLGADLVLQGSLRVQNDQLRLSLQLVDTRTQTNQWAERYDRPLAEVISIEQNIVEQIAAKLAAEARESAAAIAARRAPQELSTYELVLRARKLYYSFSRPATFEAMSLAERAATADPNYAPAWEMIARLQLQFYLQPYDQRRGNPETLNKAVEAAKKAVTLDPMYSTGHSAYGGALAWLGDYDTGLDEIRRAIELNPIDSSAIGTYADSLSKAGFQEASIEAWDAAAKLDPVVPPLNRALKARSHILLDDLETALALTRSCVERAPKLLPCQIFHTVALQLAGRSDDAKAGAMRIVELAPRFTVTGYLKLIKYRREADAALIRDALLAAGVPE